jgi:hypothetical protein
MKNTTSFRFLLVSRVLLASFALTGTVAPGLYAASFLVNTTADRHDVNLQDGVRSDDTYNCNGDPNCVLRAAIEQSIPSILKLPL